MRGEDFGGVARDKVRDDFAGAVGGVALDDDDLFRDLREGLCPDPIQKRRHGCRFVVDGDDDRYFHYGDLARHRCLE